MKCDEIFCLKNQNSKLEELLRKCENQIAQLVEAENARNANKIMANNLDTQLFCYQAHLKDLEIKLKTIHGDLYTAKAERNKLMIETFNLRRDNKNLESQIKEISGKMALTSNIILLTLFTYLVLREQLCLFAQRYKDTNSYLDNIGSKIRKDIIFLATPSMSLKVDVISADIL